MSSISVNYYYFTENQILMYNFSKQTVTSAGTQLLLWSPKIELHIISSKDSKYPYNLQCSRCLEIHIVCLQTDPGISIQCSEVNVNS